MKHLLTIALILLFTCRCGAQSATTDRSSQATIHPSTTREVRRFFSDDSFWNQPLPQNPEIDARSQQWIALLKRDPMKNFGINATRYTIPIYEINEKTPLKTVLPNSDFYQHAKDFPREVPIPDDAISDDQNDHHLALVDWSRNTAWDLWGAELKNGKWYSYTGIRYRLDGPGVFSTKELGMKNNDSVHQYGPGRASGVPIIAGLIREDEARSGRIEHKIAAASQFVAFQEFVFPAAWTDGACIGGIPEGAVIQLDPKLDLSKYALTHDEMAVARALQKYGMVLLDYAGANVIYAEGLYGQKDRNWQGRLREWDGGLIKIPIENYRVLAVKNSVHEGLRWRPNINNPHCEQWK
jgi:hypothetical protein